MSTVESLRITGDKSLARFNIRTTDQSPEQVKQRILEAFGSSLARIEMTFAEGKPIAAATAPTQERGVQAHHDTGWPIRRRPRVSLAASTPPRSIAHSLPPRSSPAVFAGVLDKDKIPNPTSRFEILKAADRSALEAIGGRAFRRDRAGATHGSRT